MFLSARAVALLLCAITVPVCYVVDRWTVVTASGCKVRARAYVDHEQRPQEQSRYDIGILEPPKGAGQWDLTLDREIDPQHYTNLSGAFSPTSYGALRQATIHAMLWHYDTLEERVTFHNLELGPLDQKAGAPDVTPRYLSLKSPLSVTTPSGIRVTFPAQGAETLGRVFRNYNGNRNALFIQLETTPNQRLILLPKSLLCRKYGQPVRIQLDCVQPNHMVFYKADNTYKTIAVGLPNLRTATHLDSLTLILRQRINLRSRPLAIRVPISSAVPQEDQ